MNKSQRSDQAIALRRRSARMARMCRIDELRSLAGLIETAKANGIEPYAYLRTVFTELPQATSVEEIEALLPAPNDCEEPARVS